MTALELLRRNRELVASFIDDGVSMHTGASLRMVPASKRYKCQKCAGRGKAPRATAPNGVGHCQTCSGTGTIEGATPSMPDADVELEVYKLLTEHIQPGLHPAADLVDAYDKAIAKLQK